MSSARIGVVACAAVITAACADPGSAPASQASATTSASASASAAPVVTMAARLAPPPQSSSSSAPLASASTAPVAATPHWLGVPVAPLPGGARPLSWDGADVKVASEWKSIGFGNGMSERDVGLLAYLPAAKDPKREASRFGDNKVAIVILYTHGAVHDSLLDYGGGNVLSMAGDVSSSKRSPPRQVEVGEVPVDVVSGEGELGSHPADIWQIRRKRPTSKGLGSSVLVLGAVRKAASKEARDAFLATLGSLVVR